MFILDILSFIWLSFYPIFPNKILIIYSTRTFLDQFNASTLSMGCHNDPSVSSMQVETGFNTDIKSNGFHTAPASYNYGSPIAASTPYYTDTIMPYDSSSQYTAMLQQSNAQAYCSPNSFTPADPINGYCSQFNNYNPHSYSMVTQNAKNNMTYDYSMLNSTFAEANTRMYSGCHESSGYATDLNTTL